MNKRFLLPILGSILVAAMCQLPAAKADALVLELVGEWRGSLEQYSHDIEGSFPVMLTVTSVSDDEFEGSMEWPAFGNSKTEVKGFVQGGVIKWTETSYLRGNDVVLFGLYVAKRESVEKIAGRWFDPKHSIYPSGPEYGVAGADIVLTRVAR